MQEVTADELNSTLRGLSVLRRFEFVANDDCSSYSLLLALAEGEESNSRTLQVEFGGVSRLTVRGFGGGLTQLLMIRIEDIHGRGWDRAYFQVDELERNSLSFVCESFRVI